MMKLWNYGRNSKLISKHIMINELMIMITIIFMMKLMTKNKWIKKQQQYYKRVVIKTIIRDTINILYNNDNDNNSDNNNNNFKIFWTWCKIGNGEFKIACVGEIKQNVKITWIQQLSWTTISRMDTWEIRNLLTICYIKPSILEEAHLVTGLD